LGEFLLENIPHPLVYSILLSFSDFLKHADREKTRRLENLQKARDRKKAELKEQKEQRDLLEENLGIVNPTKEIDTSKESLQNEEISEKEEGEISDDSDIEIPRANDSPTQPNTEQITIAENPSEESKPASPENNQKPPSPKQSEKIDLKETLTNQALEELEKTKLTTEIAKILAPTESPEWKSGEEELLTRSVMVKKDDGEDVDLIEEELIDQEQALLTTINRRNKRKIRQSAKLAAKNSLYIEPGSEDFSDEAVDMNPIGDSSESEGETPLSQVFGLKTWSKTRSKRTVY